LESSFPRIILSPHSPSFPIFFANQRAFGKHPQKSKKRRRRITSAPAHERGEENQIVGTGIGGSVGHGDGGDTGVTGPQTTGVVVVGGWDPSRVPVGDGAGAVTIIGSVIAPGGGLATGDAFGSGLAVGDADATGLAVTSGSAEGDGDGEARTSS